MDIKTIQLMQSEIEELLGMLGLSELTTEVEMSSTDTISVDLAPKTNDESSSTGLVIGSRGETLQALEYIFALMVNREREEWLRVSVDVDGYRKKRDDELRDLARKMAEKAQYVHDRVELKPMNNHDRRVIHTTLSEIEGISTTSEGEGRRRHVVITPNNGE